MSSAVKIPRRKISSRGFSLLEALLLTLIVGVGTVAWLSTMTGFMKVSKRGRASFQMVLEQQALSKIIDSMPAAAAAAASVGCMHPYEKFEGGQTCTKNYREGESIPGASAVAWTALSRAAFKWVGASNAAVLPPDQVLSREYFDNTLRPAMRTAGCMDCHAGTTKTYTLDGTFWLPGKMDAATMTASYPHVAQRDFENYDHIVRDFTYRVGSKDLVAPALASKGIFSSTLGQRLLSKQTQVEDYLSDSRGIVSTIVFSSKTITFEMKMLTPNSRQKVSPAMMCGTLNDGNACLPGEEYADLTCTERCSATGPAPTCSCGKDCVQSCGDPPCIEYTADYECLSPNPKQTMYSQVSDGNFLGTPNYTSPAWEIRPDANCGLSQVRGNSCSESVCDPSDPSKFRKCIEPGTCQRKCVQSWSRAHSCGKGCVVPSRPSGCSSQEWKYTCVSAEALSETSADITSYSINTQYTDSETGEIKTLSTGGAMK